MLPQVKGTSEAAEKGTIIHEYLADIYANVDTIESLKRIAEKFGPTAGRVLKEFSERVDVQQLPRLVDIEVEVAVAYDPRTDSCIVLGTNAERDYSKCPPGWLPGTIDLVGWDPEDRKLVLLDWKTGRTEVAPPRWNWQMRFAALAMGARYEPEHIRIALGKLADEPVIPFYDVDMERDLDRWRQALEQLQSQLIKADERKELAPLKTGPHCKYCPAYASCPAQTSLIRKLVSNPVKNAEDINSLLTKETVGIAAQRYFQVKQLMQQMDLAFKSWVESNGPIPLGDNQELGYTTARREELDGAKTFEVLKRLHGAEVAEKSCEFSTSKAAIKRALDGKVAKGQGAATERAILAAVKAADGVVTKERTEFKVHYKGSEE